MTTINQVLQIAQRELGVKEIGDSNIVKYGEWYGHDLNGQSWCAMFVSYCLYNAGLQTYIETEKGFHYTPNGAEWFKKQKQWFKDPLPGDIVFFDWQNSDDLIPGAANHVAFFVAKTKKGQIITIDGNNPPDDQSNGGEVRYQIRPLDFTVMGFGRPAYTNTIAEPLPLLNGTDLSSLTTSEDIRVWQKRMIARGYDFGTSGADGVFGRCSKKVLQEFQQKLGFKVNGVLDVLSWQTAWTAI
jgi:CHAP domain/Putative peptidoglycan binding domain